MSLKLPYYCNISSRFPSGYRFSDRSYASLGAEQNYQLLEQAAREVNVETVPGLSRGRGPLGRGEGRALAEPVSVLAPGWSQRRKKEPVPPIQRRSSSRKGGNVRVCQAQWLTSFKGLNILHFLPRLGSHAEWSAIAPEFQIYFK